MTLIFGLNDKVLYDYVTMIVEFAYLATVANFTNMGSHWMIPQPLCRLLMNLFRWYSRSFTIGFACMWVFVIISFYFGRRYYFFRIVHFC